MSSDGEIEPWGETVGNDILSNFEVFRLRLGDGSGHNGEGAGVFFAENLRHHFRLVGGITDHHRTDAGVIFPKPGVAEILDDVVEHGLDEFLMGVE